LGKAAESGFTESDGGDPFGDAALTSGALLGFACEHEIRAFWHADADWVGKSSSKL